MNVGKMSNRELLQAIKSATIELENRAYTKVLKDGLDAFIREVTKSPNQQRAELIQRAREFVERQSASERHLFSGERNTSFWGAEFVVNADKRTVVCLLKGRQTKHVYGKGIAKCMPDEVFNVDIGKAIALARALEIKIPQEFLQAVQPTEVFVGMKIGMIDSVGIHYAREIKNVGDETVGYTGGGFDYIDIVRNKGKVTDDTNAQYEEETN
ncbi:hypothetical protein H9649_07630 [Sporosarcina sp. Sa2YVA2]|uniref:Uncharacterized protein n=1 Tax=Sporosarcina quadrami TaxID=2762234 RepID=A0ABR8U8T7_9BACL|nr:hypothetical protein [Sporosarcina quadrami]MBD7984445.1 hypothetical protein [Sporosarcina quadrami]